MIQRLVSLIFFIWSNGVPLFDHPSALADWTPDSSWSSELAQKCDRAFAPHELNPLVEDLIRCLVHPHPSKRLSAVHCLHRPALWSTTDLHQFITTVNHTRSPVIQSIHSECDSEMAPLLLSSSSHEITTDVPLDWTARLADDAEMQRAIRMSRLSRSSNFQSRPSLLLVLWRNCLAHPVHTRNSHDPVDHPPFLTRFPLLLPMVYSIARKHMDFSFDHFGYRRFTGMCSSSIR